MLPFALFNYSSRRVIRPDFLRLVSLSPIFVVAVDSNINLKLLCCVMVQHNLFRRGSRKSWWKSEGKSWLLISAEILQVCSKKCDMIRTKPGGRRPGAAGLNQITPSIVAWTNPANPINLRVARPLRFCPVVVGSWFVNDSVKPLRDCCWR